MQVWLVASTCLKPPTSFSPRSNGNQQGVWRSKARCAKICMVARNRQCSMTQLDGPEQTTRIRNVSLHIKGGFSAFNFCHTLNNPKTEQKSGP